MASTGTMEGSSAKAGVVLTRSDVANLIANGRKIIIVDGAVLKVDAWLRYHPGGDKAILHMVGRDATDEVNALHSVDARKCMERYRIGRIEGAWTNFLPPIQGGIFEHDMELNERDESLDEDTTSSTTSSTAPGSPLFDVISVQNSTIRHRPRMGEEGETSSISSMEMDPSEPLPKPSHMDSYTQEAIELDLAKYPALDPATQANITIKYRDLYKTLQAEGLFNCPYQAYAIEFFRYALLFCAFVVFLRAGWYGTSGAFLGMLWHQLVFTVHDAGHMGITHDFQKDSVIGILIADFIGGLSLGWWKRNHNVHHIVTNSPEHDPDIEHMPFFAISHRFLDSLRSTYYERIMTYDSFAKFTIRYQHYLYYPVLLFGRFNLYRLSWEYLILGQGPKKGPAKWHSWLEITGQIFFWYWFGYRIMYCTIPTNGARLAFLLTSHMITAMLHVQITLSHFAMSTADLGVNESFPQKMLRTTMDVDCPQWLDFFHGGLQFQAVHHLYPRLPRHNLRRAQKLVQEFCRETGIPYALYGFVDGNKEVIGRLADVGRQAAILAKCQETIVANGIGVGH